MELVHPEDVGFSSERLKRVDAALQRLVNANQIAGAVTLIARHGKLAHFSATGLLDRGRMVCMVRASYAVPT